MLLLEWVTHTTPLTKQYLSFYNSPLGSFVALRRLKPYTIHSWLASNSHVNLLGSSHFKSEMVTQISAGVGTDNGLDNLKCVVGGCK